VFGGGRTDILKPFSRTIDRQRKKLAPKEAKSERGGSPLEGFSAEGSRPSGRCGTRESCWRIGRINIGTSYGEKNNLHTRTEKMTRRGGLLVPKSSQKCQRDPIGRGFLLEGGSSCGGESDGCRGLLMESGGRSTAEARPSVLQPFPPVLWQERCLGKRTRAVPRILTRV